MIMVMGFECGKDHVWRRRVGRFYLQVWRRNMRSTAWTIRFRIKRGEFGMVTLAGGSNRTKEKCMILAVQFFNDHIAKFPLPEVKP